MAFCFAPLWQMLGLEASHATDNALIVAMEPLMTVALARVFLGERLAPSHRTGFALALTGFALLSGWGGIGALRSISQTTGNAMMLIALIGEASYSVLGRKLLDRYEPLGIFGTALSLGVVFLTAAAAMIGGPQIFGGVAHLSWRAWAALFWLGPLGTGFAYFYWMRVLKEASVASLALTLFIQPVFGAAWGYLALGERLEGPQTLGAALILAAVLIQPLSQVVSALNSSPRQTGLG
jgi:drug/metabolite transporter (DMT)-like permease